MGRSARQDDTQSCLSELAGNAIRHGSPDNDEYLVRLVRHTHCLHLEVHDSAPHARPRIPGLTATQESGRGMHIVQELADDWGSHTTTLDTKVVRTCFRRPESSNSPCSRES
ncbi:ATP-binding protein [Streptomyces chiangmaiensis]|uniref:ATP-binding protein n=1 Tax=Streptomyces chiangmaiensis TaxID=766497 RepID=A0ABU7FV14_9ACTN|nr:ATP-binding protein [Streptomyces chiangmaiensis]MED7827942.1 ATP-binding protein [Streptomyces chiangmaiensis]